LIEIILGDRFLTTSKFRGISATDYYRFWSLSSNIGPLRPTSRTKNSPLPREIRKNRLSSSLIIMNTYSLNSRSTNVRPATTW
jgi:hypothetical protein